MPDIPNYVRAYNIVLTELINAYQEYYKLTSEYISIAKKIYDPIYAGNQAHDHNKLVVRAKELENGIILVNAEIKAWEKIKATFDIDNINEGDE